MSHENGIISVKTEGGVTYGVSISDIQAVIHSSRKDIGGLITYGDINKEAKFKPVRYPSVGVTKTNNPTFYRDVDNKCGIEIPILTATDFANPNIQSIITGASDYSYLKPRGRSTNEEWFRILDFNGYNHNASLSFQFVPPTVSRPGYININGEYLFTLRFGNLYTKTNTVSASVLSLVDLMMRFADSNGDIYAYNGSTSYTGDNPVNNGTSYGFLGVLCIYTSTIDDSVQVCLRSHSLGIASADNNELVIDFTTIYDESGAPQPGIGDTVFLAPCFTNLNSNGEWVALTLGTSYPLVKCGLFPKFPASSPSVDYISYELYSPVPTLAVLSYSIQGATIISGNSYRVSSASVSYVAVNVTAGTGTLGENNTCKITNVNNAYDGAVNNTLIVNLTFSNRQANFQIQLKDGSNNSIFMNDYISLGIQIISPNGEYQNDTIQIFPYHA